MRRLTVTAVLGALACSFSLGACSATSAPVPTGSPTETSADASTSTPGAAARAAIDGCVAELNAPSALTTDDFDVENAFATRHDGAAMSNGEPIWVVGFPSRSGADMGGERLYCVFARGAAQLVSADNAAVWNQWGLPRPS